jgi:3-methyladenine DNA glycosylase AlkD
VARTRKLGSPKVTPTHARAARFRADAAARELERELRAAGNPARAAAEKRYLKSDLRHHGVDASSLRHIVKSFAKENPELERPELLALLTTLWAQPVHECRSAAVMLLELYGGLLVPADLRLLERLLRESKTWALVDWLAVQIAGGLVEAHPKLVTALDRWASDEDFWIRRAAMLALLKPLRRGEGDFERFTRYADCMLEEREFFIRKAIGWVLREVSKKRPDIVYEWLRPRAGRASGVTVREAVKYLSEEQRAKVLAAYEAD